MFLKSIATLSFVIFFFSTGAKADKTEFSCANRVVKIILATSKVEALKSKFLMISSLHFTLQSKKISASKSEVKVSYKWPGSEDQFSTLKNPEFFKRVVDIVSPSEKEWAIEKMSADYMPIDGC